MAQRRRAFRRLDEKQHAKVRDIVIAQINLSQCVIRGQCRRQCFDAFVVDLITTHVQFDNAGVVVQQHCKFRQFSKAIITQSNGSSFVC